MQKLIVVFLLIINTNTQDCSSSCLTCDGNNGSPYSCLTCPGYTSIYLWSCQEGHSQAGYIALAVVVFVLYVFLLMMGNGVYRDLFEGLQLCTLTVWKYGSESGTAPLSGINLGILTRNSFPNSFGAQFICIMCVLTAFWVLLIMVDKIPHDSTAMLIRRKTIIFPVRIYTFFFNILLFTSLVQVATNSPSSNYLAFSLAILALIKLAIVLGGIIVVSNWNNFKIDDPNYQVLVEQFTNRRWYARNNILFALLARGVTIMSFVLLFRTPFAAGIIMIVSQSTYALYVIFALRFTKLRYYIINVIGNCLVACLMAACFLTGFSPIESSTWQVGTTCYIVLLLSLVSLLVISLTLEILIRRDIIIKQLNSLVHRFILCDRIDENITKSKFDKDGHRQRVTSFKSNLLYKQPQAEVQMRGNRNSNENVENSF